MSEFVASVSWCCEDIKGLRPSWSNKQCQEFLENIEGELADAMTEVGWQVIDNNLPIEKIAGSQII